MRRQRAGAERNGQGAEPEGHADRSHGQPGKADLACGFGRHLRIVSSRDVGASVLAPARVRATTTPGTPGAARSPRCARRLRFLASRSSQDGAQSVVP